MSRYPIHLTASLCSAGFHPEAWRFCRGEAFPIGKRFQEMAGIAERGMLEAVWLGRGDRLRIDPLPLLGSLIAGTQYLGLGAHWAVEHTEPFNVARVFATLDHLAGGRTAWIAGLPGDAQPIRQFAHTAPMDAASALKRASELIDVVRQLWDSWEDEGLLLDVPTGRFADPARVHPIQHQGAFFTVRGPLNVPRPVQGNPVVVIDFPADDAARRIAVDAADVLLVSAPSREAAMSLRAAMARTPARVLVNVTPILGATDAEARRRAEQVGASPDESLRFVGTSEQLLDLFASWVRDGICDGFNLRPAVLPDDLETFVDWVVPAGRARGLFRDAYSGTTLREHLGLPRPRSRFAA